MLKVISIFAGAIICAATLSGCAGGMGSNHHGAELGATIAGSSHPAMSALGAYIGGHS